MLDLVVNRKQVEVVFLYLCSLSYWGANEIDLYLPVLQLQEHQEDIEGMMNALFRGVFVHRYR